MIRGMLLVRNEASRINQTKYNIFYKYLEQMFLLCDTITIVDDNSTDDTVKFIQDTFLNLMDLNNKQFTFGIEENTERKWNTNELEVRKQLFDLTTKNADNGDWLICLDADELLEIDHIPYIKYLLNTLSKQINAVGFRLFDMWDMDHYRSDEFWVAHKFFYPVVIRYDKNKNYIWQDKTLHCGRFPMNGANNMLPAFVPIKHMGWAIPEERERKYNLYMETDPEGKNGVLGQYLSIMDEKPRLFEFGKEVQI